jgi:hypothetical protein
MASPLGDSHAIDTGFGLRPTCIRKSAQKRHKKKMCIYVLRYVQTSFERRQKFSARYADYAG